MTKKLTKEVKLIVSIFRDYKTFINEEDVKQSLTSNYQNVMVKGGYKDGQAVVRQMLDKADHEQYIESVHDILRSMPSTFQKIIINRYLRRMNHEGYYDNKREYHKGIIDLLDIDDDKELARTTYFRWHEKAVKKFYDEAITRMIEIKIK